MVIDFNLRPPLDEFVGEYKCTPKDLENYEKIYPNYRKMHEIVSISMDELFAGMDRAGIDMAFCASQDTESIGGTRKVTGEFVAELCKKYPRYQGLCGVDPLKGMESVRELEHCIKDLGLKGAIFFPFEYRITAADRRMYPFYAKCVELDVPCCLHSSMSFADGISMYSGHPKNLDQVACDFPELKIVAMNPGFPWVSELVGVAWRHPNFYIATSAVRAKYFGVPNSGYDVLLHYANNILANKMIYASSWPIIPFERNIQEMRELPLKPEVLEKWLGGNAARLFKLDEPAKA